jgi:hypothetical protein
MSDTQPSTQQEQLDELGVREADQPSPQQKLLEQKSSCTHFLRV